jgi:uncharacterized protein (TIGR03435 family)
MRKLALVLWVTTAALGQEFEVASIRLAKDDGKRDNDVYQGRWVTHNLTLKRLISMAFDVDEDAVAGGPAWVGSDSYDINAKIPAEYQNWTREQFRHMQQSLLAHRFGLKVHREPRQISGYALVQVKTGPKMAAAKPNDDKDSDFSSGSNTLKAANVTMESFARSLSRIREISKLVVDRTELAGSFDFMLDWSPAQAESDDHPGIFTALQEQLGLKLESAKVPVDAVIIDRAERPSEN